ncbi:MAG: GNAT family N-acetyltransferase [candidate division Zixibacteria bacterium]|nr:GNAT family N-acetyltransferase [candidate division Zixibacteria bacterium]MDD5424973.1 GNAT family N-acetyltransferase [candidate division Zixibacteria bacterium]
MPRIRYAVRQDAPIVMKLVNKLLAELRGHSVTMDETALIDKTKTFLKNKQVIALLLTTEGSDIGLITISPCKAIRTEGEYGIIQEFYIEPEFRSKGYGKELLEKAYHIARTKKWPRLEVGAPSLPQWERTLKFYEKNGFEQCGPRLKWVNQ